MMPGTTPPRNRRPIDVSVAIPYRIRVTLGGYQYAQRTPRDDRPRRQAVRVASLGHLGDGYPPDRSGGRRARTGRGGEHEHAITELMARPPGSRSTHTCAASSRSWLALECPKIAPINTKSGMASNPKSFSEAEDEVGKESELFRGEEDHDGEYRGQTQREGNRDAYGQRQQQYRADDGPYRQSARRVRPPSRSSPSFARWPPVLIR